MFTTQLLEIIRAERPSLTARCIRGFLWCLTPLYWLGWKWKQRSAADDGTRPPAPTISVGNLTTGGTGKTPMVLWIAGSLIQKGRHPAILSRGYRGEKTRELGGNDEYLELKWQLPDTPHLQDADRCKIAEAAVTDHQADCLILDDGFQHRRMPRQLDLVLIDATCPFGFGHLLPRGLLREPLSELARADLIGMTRCEQVTESQMLEIESRIQSVTPSTPILRTRTIANEVVNLSRVSQPAASLNGRKVFAFAGIGNPSNFRNTLEQANADIVGYQWFADHHAYSQTDLAQLLQQAEQLEAEILVCTLKDLVKLESLENVPSHLVALLIELEIFSGKHELEKLLDAAIVS